MRVHGVRGFILLDKPKRAPTCTHTEPPAAAHAALVSENAPSSSSLLPRFSALSSRTSIMISSVACVRAFCECAVFARF